MDGVKISVIVPVYKSEKYLPDCLAAIDRQTFRDFEVILVDDGSPDRAGEICDAYAASHGNVTVIHQENQGPSAARNNAVAVAKGTYVAFIDSDDFVTDDYLEYLLYLLEKYGVDIAIAGNEAFAKDKTPVRPERKETETVFSSLEAIQNIGYARHFTTSLWTKLYRRELIAAHPLPPGRLYEDLTTLYRIFADTDRIAFGTRVIYFYRQQPDSITHRTVREEELYGLTAAYDFLDFCRENCPEAVPAANAQCVIKITQYIPTLMYPSRKNKEVFRRLQKELEPFAGSVLRDRNVRWTHKLKIIAMRLGYTPIRLVFLAKNIRRGFVGVGMEKEEA